MKSVRLLTTVLLAVAAVTAAGAALHSRFAPGNDFTVRMLTKDTPTTLEDHSVYYLTNTLALNGGLSHNPSQPGAAALSLPENATVYIYIPSNMTLSCTGGAGCPAAPGGAQQKPGWSTARHKLYGVEHTGVEFTGAPGGKGGTGASGGGPGILVPSNSTLVVFGGGTLVATGGAGGAAAAPTNSSAAAGYAVANWCCMAGSDIKSTDQAKKYAANNLLVDAAWKGTSVSYAAAVCWNFQSVSGGGGCGGGGGGGAAIGTAGGFGGLGADGATQSNTWSWDNHAVAVCKPTGAPKSGTTSAAAGKVYIALPEGNCSLDGGAAGQAAAVPLWTVSTNEVKFTFYANSWADLEEVENCLYLISGAPGGAGGTGTAGAKIGTGGGGGGGGSGGDTGACTCEKTEENEKAVITVNVTPQSGDSGGSGTAATSTAPKALGESDYPYSTVTLENITVTNQYYFSLGTTITLPTPKSSSAVSWRLEQQAEQLVGVPNTSSAFLSDGPTDYLPNTDVTVGVSTYGDVWLKEQIRVLPKIPYRAWNGSQMEDRVCTNYTVVTDATTDFADGQWYAVTNAVSRGTITVNGSAHLILCDGATLTATGVELIPDVDGGLAGIEVAAGNALTIYGQTLGTGALVAKGGRNSAGIGASYGQESGAVTVNGGMVTTTGGNNGAGIGSGYAGGYKDDSCNQITINGGRILATGGGPGAGLGGGWKQHGGKLVINGGTIEAVAGWNGGASLGDHGDLPDPLMSVEIKGASVKADKSKISIQPSNGVGRVYCVTAKVEGLRVEKLRVEGLNEYGTNDIYSVKNKDGENCVYLWLPNGTHRFTISDGTTTHCYCAVVDGKGVTVEPLGRIGFFVDDIDIGEFGAGDGWHYQEKVLTLDGAKTCVLSGEAANNEVQVNATASGATAVLSNAVVFASGRPAVVVAQGATLTVAANQVMRVGETSGTMRYATDCGQNSCVLAGPAVTVTVKDIPHVKDVVVSNRTETISKAAVEGGTAYRVMKGDDIFVGYTVDEGYTSQVPNPLVYPAIDGDTVVDADTIRVLPHIPYRAWNAEKGRMEDLVCTDYTVVTADTEIFEGGKWYVVTGTVERGTITVNDTAHLILCDGARLMCDGAKPNAYHCGEPGILLNDPHTLSVYGQAEGTGTLEALGAEDCAGIGSGAGDSWTAGGLTVDGGVVLAIGRGYGAGIGGSNTFWWKDYGNGGTVTVNGGRVTANGGPSAAGIGGGSQGRGAAVTIRGGTVASQGGQGGFGHGYGVSDNGSLTIDGGSVKAQAAVGLAKNSTPTNVYCVTAYVEGLRVEKLGVEGLGNYGTNDIFAVDNRVYLWLPDGAHRFSISDGTTTNRYLAVVNGGDVAAERLGPIGFFVNGTDVGDAGIGDGWVYFGRVLSLTDAKAYVLSGEAANNEVQVNAAASGAMAVLSNAVVFASERPAVVVAPGASLTVAANQVMRVGGTPETMRYATDCGQNSCVLAGPAVTVTVKDIPHVKDVVVSNRTETISKATVEGGTAYRVMKGDDVFVGYTVDEGYTSQMPNPLVYVAVESDVTVDAGTIRILKNIPYRAWNEMTRQMEEKVCTDYTVVTADTKTFEDGMWYVVTNSIKRGRIEVNGSAHLILCDGARLETKGAIGTAAIIVEGWGKSLSIYGQSEGTGELEATGGDYGAGIGGGMYRSGGTITINGGKVTATGCLGGAGIGGGDDNSGGTVTINGGVVIAEGSLYAAGIGGGDHSLLTPRTARSIVINGGTVQALGEKYGLRGSLTIDGGSVLSKKWQPNDVRNSMPTNVYCVTVKCPGLEGLVGLAGLDGYGTNDIYAVANWQGVDCVYLWLPDGTHHFALSDGTTTYRYCAVVRGRAITVEPLGPVGFFVNGKDIGDTGSGEGWDYSDRNLTLSDVGPYVLSGEAMNDEVQVKVATGGATVVLSNAVVFTSGRPAFNIAQSAALQMAGGASYLAATNNAMAVSVGPNAVLAVGLAPGANEAEAMIGVFNYGDLAAIVGAGSVAVGGGTLAVWADRRASEVQLTRAADVFCMLAGNDPETARVVDKYNGEAYVLVTASVAPVTPGTPFGSFTTAEAATNAMRKAVLAPRDDVEAALGSGAARQTYCDMFGFAVTGGDTDWFVEAVLHPEAWTNVVLSAQAATRQIPVADIAALPLNTPTNVTVKACCVPGFFYSVYAGSTVTNLGAVAAEKGRNVLCGTDKDVEFSGVVKPSDAAGFFSIGVKEAPSVTPSDRAELDPPAITDVKTAGD